MTHTHHWCDWRYEASWADYYKLCTIYFAVSYRATFKIRNSRIFKDADAQSALKNRHIADASNRTFVWLSRDRREKRPLVSEKETVSIEIFYAQFPTLARIYREADRFWEFKSRLNPGSKLPTVKTWHWLTQTRTNIYRLYNLHFM